MIRIAVRDLRRPFLPMAFAVLLGLPGLGAATPAGEAAIRAALADPIRDREERARDETRKPVETLAFFGFEPSMTVIELMPGNGWYTKVLGKAMAPGGRHLVAVGTGRVAPKLGDWGLPNTELVTPEVAMLRDKARPGFVFDLDPVRLPVAEADLVLTFRNVHNLTEAARADLNRAVFAALKPGGVYGVVGHTGRHMATGTDTTWRRKDPVQIIQEVLAAGFRFEGYATLHHRPQDPLNLDTTDPTIGRDSDRFTLKFVKPRER